MASDSEYARILNSTEIGSECTSFQIATGIRSNPGAPKAERGVTASNDALPDGALVYAVGTLNYDFGTQPQKDAFAFFMREQTEARERHLKDAGWGEERRLLELQPDVLRDMLIYLGIKRHSEAGSGVGTDWDGWGNVVTPQGEVATYSGVEYDRASLIWTIEQDGVPVYAIDPRGPYAFHVYENLLEMLDAQYKPLATRASFPGVIHGVVKLLSEQRVPVIVPDIRGIRYIPTTTLVAYYKDKFERETGTHEILELNEKDIEQFLLRVYGELRNKGLRPQDRAMNHTVQQLFSARMFAEEAARGRVLDTITAEASEICRPGSDCWVVNVRFFDPKRREQSARRVHRYTIDVSNTIPVLIGRPESWDVY